MSENSDKPFIAPWMGSDEINFRNNVREYLQQAISEGLLPGKKAKSISIFSTGQASVVHKVEMENGVYVVKMSGYEGILQKEAVFLNEWRKQCVVTPKILSLSAPSKQCPVSMLVMEYIDAPLLKDRSIDDMISGGISYEIGQISARIHRVKGSGYGIPIDGNEKRGEFATFTEEMEEIFNKRVPTLMKQGIIGSKDVEVARRAVEIVELDIKEGTLPSLIHGDLRPYNIFDTKPLTVFDPNPRVTHPFWCLSLTLMKPLVDSELGQKERAEILRGYKEISPVDENVLSAMSVLRAIALLYTWNKKGKDKRAQKLVEILRVEESKIK